MKRIALLLVTLVAVSCNRTDPNGESLALIQIQDRNGLTETISNPDRLITYETVDFLSSQPYKQVLRVYRNEGGNRSRISSYYPNGSISQYLEGESMRAHGAYREWFPNGQQRIEATVVGGTADLAPGAQEDWLFDGISQVWDEQGNIVAKISYEKGSLEGTTTHYFPSGQVQREAFFAKDAMEGEVVEFFPNGTVVSKTLYRKGLKNGESSLFSEEGKLLAKEHFNDGLLLKGIYYNVKGETLSQIDNGGGFQAILERDGMKLVEYRFGRPEGLIKQLTPAGELKRTFFVKNSKKEGEEIEYYPSSEIETSTDASKPLPKLSIMWRDNAVHGSVKTWYSNGQIESQRDYARSQKAGPALAWYKNGSFRLVEEYEEGVLQSGQYFKMNRSDPVSTIVNGTGLATLYDETGALLRKVSYSKGKPIEQ